VKRPFTSQDWFLILQRSDLNFDVKVLWGPIPSQILRERIDKIVSAEDWHSIVFLEDLKMIVFYQPLHSEQIEVLQGDSFE
jgi:hypothetical protein